jgi:hypothetical protein
VLDATPLMKMYAGRRKRQLGKQNAVEVQRLQLLRLLARARNTRFGMDHRFFAIGSVEMFQKQVPLRRYEAFWKDYWKPNFPRLIDCTWPGAIPFFAVSSGTTTGVTKHIPCTHEMNAANKRAALDILVHHLNTRPQSKVLAGRSFMLGGSTDLVEVAAGVQSGDLSGIAATTVPWWARPRYFPPRHLETITDWEEKISRLAPESLKQDIRAIGGTPSWLLLFFDRLADLRPGSGRHLASFYPNLELLIHGGVGFVPYRKLFDQLLADSRAETREVYAASEGFFAIADRGDGEGLRLIVDNGLFYEFVPVDELDSPGPTRHWLSTVETGVNYALAISSCAGLWSYVVGDTVRLIDRDPPRLLITGRTSYSLSAFGEHLIGEEIEEAVTAAAEAIGANISDYAVGALYPEKEGDVGGHLYIVEFAERISEPARVASFGSLLDEWLSAVNEDYKVHRAGNFALRAPTIHVVAPGTYAAWMKTRGQLGGQHKVPRVINDPDLFENLREFITSPGG